MDARIEEAWEARPRLQEIIADSSNLSTENITEAVANEALTPVTMFPDQFAQEKTFGEYAWGDITQMIAAPAVYSSKRSCPFIKLASFGDKPSEKKCLRHDKNVTGVGGIEGDYDAGAMSMEDAADLLTSARIKCVLYTSASHTNANPRWRVLAPLSEVFTGTTDAMKRHRKQMVGRIDAVLGGVLADESYTLSQAFYFGKVRRVDYESAYVEGDCIDLRDDLAVSQSGSQKVMVPLAKVGGDFDFKSAINAIITGTNFHRSTISLAMHYIGIGASEADAIAQLEATYHLAAADGKHEKWQARFDAIPAAVASAIAKQPNLAIGGVFGAEVPVIEDAEPEMTELVDTSEDTMALLFADRNPHYRWIQERGKWMEWGGRVWEPDNKLHVMTAVRSVARTVAACVSKESEAKALKKSASIHAVQTLAKSDPRLAANMDQWDSNLWGFNTAGGILDLKTGTLNPHDPRAYMTKMSPVAPGGECPRWMQFMREVTNNDQDLIDYLARIAGLSMIGQVLEHKLFFLYGTGRNGKGVFINTLMHVFGEYAGTSPIDMLMETHHARHPTDLADLVGRRLATAEEVDKGENWAEAKVKYLTGGSNIKARFMRQDFFEFVPQHTLIVVGNHKPKFRNVDEAIRGRLQLIPFTQHFSVEKQDKYLTENLQNEAGGILQWCIDGCMDYQKRGDLEPPAAVTVETKEYLDDQDILQRWIKNSCTVGPKEWAKQPDVFASWEDFCRRTDQVVGQKSDLYMRVERAGFKRRKAGSRGRYFNGLSVNKADAYAALADAVAGAT